MEITFPSSNLFFFERLGALKWKNGLFDTPSIRILWFENQAEELKDSTIYWEYDTQTKK